MGRLPWPPRRSGFCGTGDSFAAQGPRDVADVPALSACGVEQWIANERDLCGRDGKRTGSPGSVKRRTTFTLLRSPVVDKSGEARLRSRRFPKTPFTRTVPSSE